MHCRLLGSRNLTSFFARVPILRSCLCVNIPMLYFIIVINYTFHILLNSNAWNLDFQVSETALILD